MTPVDLILLVVTATVITFLVARKDNSRRLPDTTLETAYEIFYETERAAQALWEGRGVADQLCAITGATTVTVVTTDGTVECSTPGALHVERAGELAELALQASQVVTSDESGMVAVAVPVITPDRSWVLVGFSEADPAALRRRLSWAAACLARDVLVIQREEIVLSQFLARISATDALMCRRSLFNWLHCIWSMTRTAPERARELLLDLSNLMRYAYVSMRSKGNLADELRCVDQFLLLERARLGSRLSVTLDVEPSVLFTTAPFPVIVPLVKNAVQHSESVDRKLLVTLMAFEDGPDVCITIDDNGPGIDFERAYFSANGLLRIDQRLRATFGPHYGLVVETGPDAGTNVLVRLPRASNSIGLGQPSDG
ncbi:sensor histidine kinase [Lentzea sp. E54]|uniref:sensor histidine kinase n=1 Tax=Lentzea xerophila TaxID=3435883 RepID=UPI003DA460E0